MELLNDQREDCEQLPTHKKQILKLFREGKDMIKVFYFIRCALCNKIFEKDSENLEQVKCCDKILKKTETNFYIYVPLQKQIVQSINNNWQDIKNFDTTSKDDNSIFSDAHDGDVLKEVLKLYENQDLNILSLCVNVDGANKFNSNLASLWPIQFTQNYLPPKTRFLPDNILVAGLLYVEDKFDFREYFLPVVRELHNAKHRNIVMTIEHEVYTFKPIVTHCAVDLPAKAKLQETKQFGGYNACSYCEIPGEQITVTRSTKNTKKKKQGGNDQAKQVKKVVYPERDRSYPLRNEQDTLNKMLAASSTKDDVGGIKGKTLSAL